MGNVFSPKHKWRKTVHDTTIQENVKKTKQKPVEINMHSKSQSSSKEKTFKWINSKIQYKL